MDADTAEILTLPDEQKKELCIELLHEFGVSSYNQRGFELQHRCTLNLGGHSDGNSMTASVNFHKMEVNCFVCGHGGSLAWWVAVNRRLDTDDIQPWLRKRLGIGTSLPIHDLLRVIDMICNPKEETEKMPVYNDKILSRWTGWGMFHPYLTEVRKIPEENLARFNVGYADEDEEFGYTQRVIIPARWDGRLVGWQARALSPDDPEKKIKYKNSPGFPRDRILYGDNDHGFRHAVVVESPMSVLRHVHNGPIVATFGSQVTRAQLRYLGRFQSLTLFNENDKAGRQTIRNLIYELSRSVRVSVVDNPYVKSVDPADLDDSTYNRLVDEAVPSAIWKPKEYSKLINY